MSKKQLHTSTGRGALINPTNRFLKTEMGEDFHEFHPDEESENKKTTFKLFVLFLKDAQLITGEVVAMDGTKVRANNSKKSNYSPKKIERHLAYIEEKTNEYLAVLEQNDLNEKSVEKVKNIQEKIAKLSTNKN